MIYKKLQYISQGQTPKEQLQHIKEVLDAGCSWVQLRFKNADAKQLTLLAEQVREKCTAYKAVFIMNDHPEIAHAVEADGVHLGLKDISIKKARTILGSKKIIGGTANTLNDVAMRLQEDCDYIGLGPYRHTSTKENLSPILGLTGYHNILSELQKLNVGIPVYAIGGIEPADIPLLLEAGIYGVAVSGALTNKPDTKAIIQHINSNLYATA